MSKGSRKPLYQNHYIQLPLTLKITMLCQISGSLDVNILPNKECTSHCAKKKITLKPGEICKLPLFKFSTENSSFLKNISIHLQVTMSNMWRVTFRKADDQDTITVALFGH